MATPQDVNAVLAIVDDALRVLDWSAGDASSLVDDGLAVPVVSDELRPGFAAAVDQVLTSGGAGDLALRTLRGANPAFPMDQVLQALAQNGWDGALLTFKLQALAAGGRADVMATAGRGRGGGGGIAGRPFHKFLKILDAALGSLGAIPGVDVIKELKEFLEASLP
ncbi:hypothetical protein ACPC54_36315 [Kitasatospora sp. NPDC094028]